jgi:hypothetical protein
VVLYYDIQVDKYIHPPTNLLFPDLLICGNENAAYTSTDNNVIAFCPPQFMRPITLAGMTNVPAPQVPGLPGSPDLLDDFNPMSMTFLHEYTHFLGRIGNFPK